MDKAINEAYEEIDNLYAKEKSDLEEALQKIMKKKEKYISVEENEDIVILVLYHILYIQYPSYMNKIVDYLYYSS